MLKQLKRTNLSVDRLRKSINLFAGLQRKSHSLSDVHMGTDSVHEQPAPKVAAGTKQVVKSLFANN